MNSAIYDTSGAGASGEMVEARPSRHPDVCAILKQELARGRYAVGSLFPGEIELQQRFGVGRHTARQALVTLAEEGYIDRRRRRGTLVLCSKPQAKYVHLLGSLSNLVDFSVISRLDVRAFGRVRLRSSELCAWLKLPLSSQWLRIAGVRTHRDTRTPLCWTEHYIPIRYAVKADAVADPQQPVYELVAHTWGFEIDHVEQEIGATAIPVALAGPLQAASESPALIVIRHYHRVPGQTDHEDKAVKSLEAPGCPDTLTQISMNIFPAGRYCARSRIVRDV